MNHHLQSNMEMGSGLTRYRSAPSSYFASLLDSSNNNGFGNDDFSQLFNPRPPSSPQTQRIFSRFMNSSDLSLQEDCSSNISVPQQSQLQQPPQLNAQFLQPEKNETDVVRQTPPPQLKRQRSNDCSSVPRMMYQTHNNHVPSSSAVGNSYPTVLGQMKMDGGGGGGSGLIRHCSSPAGLFADIDIEREVGAMRGFEPSYVSSRHSSCSGMMSPISEIGNKGIGENSRFDEDHGNGSDYIGGFSIDSWEDSAILSDNFLKEFVDSETKPFSNVNASDDHRNAITNEQNIECGSRNTNVLSHQLSLPTSSAELLAMEKAIQDSVPCKIRAKRGCATHPRSIAERVRRTKISQRMRKLQELVPNMDKQTNTSDMLDLAVEYINDLQSQVKNLSEKRARCSCLAEGH